MKKIAILLLLVLSACLVPEPEPIQKLEPVRTEQAVTPQGEPLMEEILPVKTVTQNMDGAKRVYGYDENDRLVYFESEKGTWTFYYDDDLVKIDGPEPVSITRVNSTITQISTPSETKKFSYDEFGRLQTVESGETLHFEWDANNQLAAASRGVAGEIRFDHKGNKTTAFERGPTVTNIVYDDKDRVKMFSMRDEHFILGYWRDNKLIKMTGSTLGKGIEVSYGPDYPPTTAKMISAEDSSTFTATETGVLYDAVDQYIYCNYVRRLPVSFDGITYVTYENYFNGTISEYLVQQQICEVMQ